MLTREQIEAWRAIWIHRTYHASIPEFAEAREQLAELCDLALLALLALSAQPLPESKDAQPSEYITAEGGRPVVIPVPSKYAGLKLEQLSGDPGDWERNAEKWYEAEPSTAPSTSKPRTSKPSKDAGNQPLWVRSLCMQVNERVADDATTRCTLSVESATCAIRDWQEAERALAESQAELLVERRRADQNAGEAMRYSESQAELRKLDMEKSDWQQCCAEREKAEAYAARLLEERNRACQQHEACAVKMDAAQAELRVRDMARTDLARAVVAETDLLAARAELAAARADAERGHWMLRNCSWYRGHECGDSIVVYVAAGSDLSCIATREDAIDAARREGGKENG